jgi:hypothetical protein
VREERICLGGLVAQRSSRCREVLLGQREWHAPEPAWAGMEASSLIHGEGVGGGAVPCSIPLM